MDKSFVLSNEESYFSHNVLQYSKILRCHVGPLR